jgi:DNA polymerase-3 subunit epsilon
MLLCGIDLETTGLDKETCSIIEIGFAVWDTERKKILTTESILVSGSEIPHDIAELTGIWQMDADMFGLGIVPSLSRLFFFMEACHYAVAHNGNEFDKPFLMAECERAGMLDKLPNIPWIDTSIDVPYPDSITTRKLTYLAAEHGYVNRYQHRAVFDVLAMFAVLENYDIKEVIKRSESQSILIKAGVSYDTRELAKARGYRWNAERKEWHKVIKECDLSREFKESEFKITVLEER